MRIVGLIEASIEKPNTNSGFFWQCDKIHHRIATENEVINMSKEYNHGNKSFNGKILQKQTEGYVKVDML